MEHNIVKISMINKEIKRTRFFIVRRITRKVDPMTNGGQENCEKELILLGSVNKHGWLQCSLGNMDSRVLEVSIVHYS